MLALNTSIDRDSGTPRSQASYAYQAIRADILTARHLPNKKLKIVELAAELGVSPGAVREALSKLVPEQLVVSRDQRGFVVAPISVADLEDLTDLRCEIEAIALRRSVQRGDVDWEAGVLAAAHRLRSLPVPVAGEESPRRANWIAAHAVFHAALVAACGSKRLLALHAQLYEQSERYRGLSGQVEVKRDIADEHKEITDLALARDAEGLVDATIKHLRMTTTMIVKAAQKQVGALD